MTFGIFDHVAMYQSLLNESVCLPTTTVSQVDGDDE